MKRALPEIDEEKCTGCGTCAEFCPTGAVTVENGKVTVINAEACSYCTECEPLCPTGAIRCPFEIVLVNPAKTPKRPHAKGKVVTGK